MRQFDGLPRIRGNLAAQSLGPAGGLRTRLVTGTAFSFVSIVVGQALALATSIVYARILGPANLGIFVVYVQLGALAGSLAGLGLGIPIARFVAQLRAAHPERLGDFVGMVLLLTLASSAGMSVSLFLLSEGLGGAYGSQELVLMLRIGAAFLVLDGFAGVGSALLQGLQKVRLLSTVGIVIESLTLPVMLFSLSAFGLIGGAIGGAVMTITGGSLLFGAPYYYFRSQGIHLRLSFERGFGRDLARYAAPLLGSMLVIKLAFLYQASALALTLGYSDTGLFRVASTVSRLVAFVPAAMSVPLLPALAELYSSAPAERTRRSVTSLLRISAYVGGPLALAVGLGASLIIELLYGPEYALASVAAFVLVAAGYVDIVDAIATNSLLGEGRTVSLLAIDAIQAIVIVGVTASLLNTVGLLGAALGSLAGSLIYGVMIFGALARNKRIHLRRVVPAFALGAAEFSLATIAVLWGDGQSNLWFQVGFVGVTILASWLVMETEERHLIRSAARDLLRR